MSKKKLFITDERMLELMQYCIANNIQGITTIKEWATLVGIEPTNIHNVREGVRRFTVDQIMAACKQFSTPPDFIFGFSTQIIRSGKTISPMQLLKIAVRGVEVELQQKNRTRTLQQKLKQK